MKCILPVLNKLSKLLQLLTRYRYGHLRKPLKNDSYPFLKVRLNQFVQYLQLFIKL